MASTPTPVDDNRLNTNDECMYNAIDKVMSSSEQTYDEFMNSFTQLKREDLEPKNVKQSSDQPLEDTEQPAGEALRTNQQYEADDEKVANKVNEAKDENELQEEVLEIGVVCGWMNKEGNQTSSVQFDNFLDNEDEDSISGVDITDTTASGYSASFATGSCESNNLNRQSQDSFQEHETVKESSPANISETNKKKRGNQGTRKQASAKSQTETDSQEGEQEDIASAQESIEAMKNILLENFLSDFCEEMGLGGMVDMNLGAMGFDDTEETLQTEDVTFDEDPLELLLSITDTGDSAMKNYVKETLTKSTDSDTKTVPKSKKKSRSRRRKKCKTSGNSEQNISKEDNGNTNKSVAETETGVEHDSEAKSNDSNKRHEEVSKVKTDVKESDRADIVSIAEPKNTQEITDTSDCCEANVSSKLLYPGEVDDDVTSTGVSKETSLEFKATYRELPDHTSKTEDCSNEVEAFVLDESFDYDNVVLTPKYSPEDMERLSQLMTGKVTL